MRKKLAYVLVPLLFWLAPMAAYGQLEPVLGTTLQLVDAMDTPLGEALVNAMDDGGAGVMLSTSEGVGLIYFLPTDGLAYTPKVAEVAFSEPHCTGTPYARSQFGVPVDVSLLVAGDTAASVYADAGEPSTAVLLSLRFPSGTCLNSDPTPSVVWPLVKVGELNTEFAPPFFLNPVQRRGVGPPPGHPRGRRGPK